MEKLFQCVWGEGYGETCTEQKPLEFFSWRVGYDQEQIYIVESLKVGDTADFSCVTGTHYVTRIK